MKSIDAELETVSPCMGQVRRKERAMQKRLAACQILSFANPTESADKVLHWMAEAARLQLGGVLGRVWRW